MQHKDQYTEDKNRLICIPKIIQEESFVSVLQHFLDTGLGRRALRQCTGITGVITIGVLSTIMIW